MAKIKEYEKLNTTGSCYKHIPTDTIYSYRTPIYQEFLIGTGKIKCFNDTYYSMTTRKHQGIIWRYRNQSDIIFHYCPYGYWTLDTALKNEITMVTKELTELQNKNRKLGKRQTETLKELQNRLDKLTKLYEEV